MSITADIHTDPFGDIMIHLKGRLNYEVNPELKKELLTIQKEFPSSTIILDFEQVDFVGSSGLGQFVEMVNCINKDYLQLKIMNIRIEFVKVFQLYQLYRLNDVIPEEERVAGRKKRRIVVNKRAELG